METVYQKLHKVISECKAMYPKTSKEYNAMIIFVDTALESYKKWASGTTDVANDFARDYLHNLSLAIDMLWTLNIIPTEKRHAIADVC